MRYLRICFAALIMAVLLLCACSVEEDPAATAPQPDAGTAATESQQTQGSSEPDTTAPGTTTAAVSTAGPSDTPATMAPATAGTTAPPGTSPTGEDNEFWTAYYTARIRTSQLAAREQQMMVYTIQGSADTPNEQTINMKVRTNGQDTLEPSLYADGTVKANGQLIPMQIYFRGGTMYRISGDNQYSEAAEFDQVLASVDVTDSFVRYLTKDTITEITGTRSMDGTTVITIVFRGMFGDIDTAGTGEVVINSEGIIISQGFNMETIPADGLESSVVRQSVECTMLSYGNAVAPIVFPESITETPEESATE